MYADDRAGAWGKRRRTRLVRHVHPPEPPRADGAIFFECDRVTMIPDRTLGAAPLVLRRRRPIDVDRLMRLRPHADSGDDGREVATGGRVTRWTGGRDTAYSEDADAAQMKKKDLDDPAVAALLGADAPKGSYVVDRKGLAGGDHD